MFAAPTPPRHPAALRVRKRVPTAAVLVGVLVLHAVLLLMAARLGVWHDRVSAREPIPRVGAPLMLRLLDRATPQPATAADGAAPQSRVVRRRPAGSLPALLPATPGEPQAITPPSLPAAMPSAPEPMAQKADTSSPAAAALNLALPRAASSAWRQRNPALDDARANSGAPVNMATSIARALGGDPYGAVSEEHLADGSVRFRRGGQCVVSRPNQAQKIDPFNGSALPKPRLLDRC